LAGSPARAARKSPTPRRALIEEQVRQKAAAVFAANGYANTSLGDIADALGAGRTALYHYYAQQAHQVLREWLAFDESRGPAELGRFGAGQGQQHAAAQARRLGPAGALSGSKERS
jgi:hypothetical protein